MLTCKFVNNFLEMKMNGCLNVGYKNFKISALSIDIWQLGHINW